MAVATLDDGYMRLVGQLAAAKRYHPESDRVRELAQEVAILRTLRFIGRLEEDGPMLTDASRRRLARVLLEGTADSADLGTR
jgi:predicted transcriptional regulator